MGESGGCKVAWELPPQPSASVPVGMTVVKYDTMLMWWALLDVVGGAVQNSSLAGKLSKEEKQAKFNRDDEARM